MAAVLGISAVVGFSLQPSLLQQRVPHQPLRSKHITASAADITTSWQPAALSNLVQSLQLEEKPYAADLGYGSFSIGGAAGGVQSFEAPGKKNVAWCSGLKMSDGAETARASVTTWVGPLSDVPHLVAACGVSNGGIDLLIDFRPRAESGYTSEDVYEAPDSREKFAMSGNRMDFGKAFFTEEAVAWRASLLALDGAVHTPRSAEDMATYSSGPLYTSLRLPLTDASASAAANACQQATEQWLMWMQTSTENKRDLPAGAKQTMAYARDTKIRASSYGALLGLYTGLYGEEGKGLAAADAGPLDEAYVGGAS